MKLWAHNNAQNDAAAGEMPTAETKPKPPGTRAATSWAPTNQPFRTMRADIVSVTFTGNSDLCLDGGGLLRADRQGWTPKKSTSSLFEGSFCIPILNVEIRIEDALPFPVRMRLTGEADNRMLFTREFTFPAGKHHRVVRDIESDRPAGGVFGAIDSIRWFLESSDISIDIGEHRETRNNIYFIPKHGMGRPPQDTVLHILCHRLDGLPLGHPEALQRIWEAFENLSLTAADGQTRIVCADARRAGRTAEELLHYRAGGCEAWVDLFLVCLRIAGSVQPSDVSPDAGEPWPWTVAEQDIKVRLLEAKCRHVIKHGKQEDETQ